MSTPFYDLASLVVVPSGYKSGKVYAQKPQTTDGQLTFTRASSATRVASNGLIEKVRTNSALQSQTFENASWTKNAGATITANTTTAPDGTLTAETLNVATTIFSGLYQLFTTSTNSWTTSLFVKKGTKDFIYLFDPSTNLYAWFNLTTGAVGQKTASTEAAMISVGNGWYRISVTTAVAGNASHFIQFGLSDANGSFIPATTGTAFIWGAQAEVSDFGATDYIPTTTAAVSVGPVSGLPRLDYLNSTCPKLLLEPQRTNLLNFSEQFNNVYWDKDVGITVNANAAASPDGNINADRINFASSNQAIYKLITATGAHRFSIYLKGEGANIGKQIQLELPVSINVTLTGDWQRFVGNADNAGSVAIKRISAGQADSVLAYGAQLEAGAYATSYIPTLSASVTRVADACVKTGISSLIGQTEGTIFVDFDFTNISGVQVLVSIHDSANNKRFEIWANSAVLNGFIGGSVDITIGSSSITNGRHKAALAYKQSGDQAFYIDGVQIGTSATAYTIAALTALSFDYWSTGFPPTEKVAQALLFKTRLTNAQLAELTAL